MNSSPISSLNSQAWIAMCRGVISQGGFRQSAIDPDRSRKTPYSHSIINELSKLLIRKALAAASKIFTVTFTVKVSGTSIGGGLRAIRRKATFRDLSTTISS
jgi:hypothetical protein